MGTLIKTKFYYFRDDNNHPIVTVCVMKYKENIARGISICNAKDNIDKKIGRRLAKRRAISAIYYKKTRLKIRKLDVLQTLFDLDDFDEWIFFKSDYNPELTEFESRLLKI